MAKAINLTKTENFVCSIDKDEPKTKWKITAVDSIVVASALSGENGKTAEAMMELTRFGLKGFEDFTDDNGKKIEISFENAVLRGRTYEVVSRNVLATIPVAYIVEIGTRILSFGSLSGEQRKN